MAPSQPSRPEIRARGDRLLNFYAQKSNLEDPKVWESGSLSFGLLNCSFHIASAIVYIDGNKDTTWLSEKETDGIVFRLSKAPPESSRHRFAADSSSVAPLLVGLSPADVKLHQVNQNLRRSALLGVEDHDQH